MLFNFPFNDDQVVPKLSGNFEMYIFCLFYFKTPNFPLWYWNILIQMFNIYAIDIDIRNLLDSFRKKAMCYGCFTDSVFVGLVIVIF